MGGADDREIWLADDGVGVEAIDRAAPPRGVRMKPLETRGPGALAATSLTAREDPSHDALAAAAGAVITQHRVRRASRNGRAVLPCERAKAAAE